MPAAALLQRVRHRPDDIMALVAEVENYPRFIGLISALRVTKETQLSESHTHFEAEAVVAYKFILKAFPLEMLARDKFDKVATKIMAMFIDYAGETLDVVGEADFDVSEDMARLGLKKPLTV